MKTFTLIPGSPEWQGRWIIRVMVAAAVIAVIMGIVAHLHEPKISTLGIIIASLVLWFLITVVGGMFILKIPRKSEAHRLPHLSKR